MECERNLKQTNISLLSVYLVLEICHQVILRLKEQPLQFFPLSNHNLRTISFAKMSEKDRKALVRITDFIASLNYPGQSE
jgi:hypothetical protein